MQPPTAQVGGGRSDGRIGARFRNTSQRDCHQHSWGIQHSYSFNIIRSIDYSTDFKVTKELVSWWSCNRPHARIPLCLCMWYINTSVLHMCFIVILCDAHNPEQLKDSMMLVNCWWAALMVSASASSSTTGTALVGIPTFLASAASCK